VLFVADFFADFLVDFFAVFFLAAPAVAFLIALITRFTARFAVFMGDLRGAGAAAAAGAGGIIGCTGAGDAGGRFGRSEESCGAAPSRGSGDPVGVIMPSRSKLPGVHGLSSLIGSLGGGGRLQLTVAASSPHQPWGATRVPRSSGIGTITRTPASPPPLGPSTKRASPNSTSMPFGLRSLRTNGNRDHVR
jgi:hypothetical protein